MKKFFVTVCTGLLLAGCGSSTIVKETRICTYDMGGIEANYTMEAENDIINKLSISVEMPSYLFDSPNSISELTELDKEILGDLVLLQMGLKRSDGINIDFDIKEKNLIPIVTFDFDKIDSDVMEQIGLLKDSKLSETVTRYKMIGAKCR